MGIVSWLCIKNRRPQINNFLSKYKLISQKGSVFSKSMCGMCRCNISEMFFLSFSKADKRLSPSVLIQCVLSIQSIDQILIKMFYAWLMVWLTLPVTGHSLSYKHQHRKTQPGCCFPNRMKLVILCVVGRYEQAAEHK